MAGLKLDRVGKDFGDFRALNGVTLHVGDGEFVAVLGPSGCGKTTMLRLIAGFEKISCGTISLDDQLVSAEGLHVPPERRRIGVVFQSYALWPHMTVAGNVAYPLRVARVAAAERARRAAQALEMVGMTGFEARRPAELSGGQCQRVALARCLVMEPRIVLLDEPLANLDVHLRASMQREFAEFHRRTRIPMVYITHDQAEAMALADNIAVISAGEIVQVAAPSKLYWEPATPMVAHFIGRGSVAAGAVLSAEEGGRVRARIFGDEMIVRAAAGQLPCPSVRICLRPEDLAVRAPGSNGAVATVKRRTYQGGLFTLEVVPQADPETTLLMQVAEPSDLAVGAVLALEIRGGWVIPGPGSA
ncbi:MAG: ABC transporter ATP-binding protein [Pseudomonadota bacterium]